MARFIGLDIGARYVRVAAITTAYRRVAVERLEEVPIADPEDLRTAITTAASHLLAHAEGVGTAVEGDQVFSHRFSLPATASISTARTWVVRDMPASVGVGCLMNQSQCFHANHER